MTLIGQSKEVTPSSDDSGLESTIEYQMGQPAETGGGFIVSTLRGVVAFAATTGDQALVSFSSFGVTIVVGRLLGPGGFGLFTLLWSAALFLNVVQQSFIVAPMLTLASKYAGRARSRYFGSVLTLQVFLAITLSILVAACYTLGVWCGFFAPEIKRTILPLACACFFFQMQEFIRRMLQATYRPVAALLCDLTTYGLQIVILSWMLLRRQGDMGTIFWTLAGTWMAGCVFFAAVRGQIELSRFAVASARDIHLSFGRPLALTNLFQWFSGYGALYIVAARLSPAAVGNARAAMNIVAPLNVLAVGIQIFLSIEAAQIYRSEGVRALTRLLRCYAVAFTLACAPLFLAMSVWGRPLVRMLLGARFEIPTSWIVAQFACVVAGALFGFAVVHFKTIERTKYTALAAGCGLLLTLTVTVMLVNLLGTGAFFVGLLAGQVGMLCCAGWFWLRSIRERELG
jgi:O-antigen/teichoic acid export membrane protein